MDNYFHNNYDTVVDKKIKRGDWIVLTLKDFFKIKPQPKKFKSMYSFYRSYMINMDDYSKPDSETSLITFKALDYELKQVIKIDTIKIYAPNFSSCLLVWQPRYERMLTIFDNYIFIDNVFIDLLTNQREYGHSYNMYNSLKFLKDKDFKIPKK